MPTYRAIAEYYDPECAAFRMLREDVPFFLNHLPKRRQSVLELCAGTARAAIPIAQAGHRVVGVDYAPDMLAIGRRKRDAVGLTDRDLTLTRVDARTLKLKDRFDWICIFFNTLLAFTTLDALDAVLQSVRRHLKPNGRFWLDIFNPDHGILARGDEKNREHNLFYVPIYGRTVLGTTDIRRDMSRQRMQITNHYHWFDERGREHTDHRAFDMTIIFPRELELLLDRNGLVIEKLYGNYDGSPLSRHSPRMIAVARIAGRKAR